MKASEEGPSQRRRSENEQRVTQNRCWWSLLPSSPMPEQLLFRSCLAKLRLLDQTPTRTESSMAPSTLLERWSERNGPLSRGSRASSNSSCPKFPLRERKRKVKSIPLSFKETCPQHPGAKRVPLPREEFVRCTPTGSKCKWTRPI